ncbi:MAG: hypothetical protein E6Q97_37725 [Desulfurellales bacterium]|nr:MAG: hypothetical protein E6Q97_37725 [Desulfurellales bacterium]
MLVSMDIETSVVTGEPACLTWCVVTHGRGVGGSTEWGCGPEMGLHARDPEARATFEGWLDDPDVVLLGQNVAFDLVTLGRWWGLLPEVVAAYEAGRVRDTMLRQDLIDIASPARACGVWNEEHERWFPAKFAWHAGLQRIVRIDGGENEDGGGSFAKGGLDHLAWRLLAVDVSKSKHDEASPRMRYHDMLDVPWEEWPEEFRTYALGDPSLTLRVYLAQAADVRQRSRTWEQDDRALPSQMFADGWTGDEVEAPLADEQFQVMAAVPFQVMSARGVRVDVELVRAQRRELAALRTWASDLCVKYGTMREEYDFVENDAERMKPLRKGESPTPERVYRSARARWRSLAAKDPEWFASFVDLARKLGKLRGVSRKVDDAEKRRRVAERLAARGLPVAVTKSKKVKADADALYDAATPSIAERDASPAAADLAAILGPGLLKVARKALAGEAGWSLNRLAAAIAAAEDPGLAALAVHSKAEKFDTSFLRGLDVPDDRSPEVRAWFRTMMETGRTSMVGAIRQNMPKAGGVRECIVPRSGYVFVQCDYSQIELLGLAYVLDVTFGRESALTRAIRDGTDCHLLLACHPILGLGLDYATAKTIRKQGNAYLEEVGSVRSIAETRWPEFDWATFDRIEKGRFCAKAANFGFPGGMMPRKFAATQKKQAGLVLSIEEATKLREAWLATWPEVGDYFVWAKGMTSGNRTARVRHLDGSGEPGHWRGGCGYTQLCNTLFQGLVARGAKWAAWQLFKECYMTPDSPLAGAHPILFVHDEFVLEVPVDHADAALPALIRVMVESMQSVMPGQAIRAEGKILAERWTK